MSTKTPTDDGTGAPAPIAEPQPPPKPEVVAAEIVPPADGDGGLIAELSMVRMEFSGPLPHPSILAGYDRVLPGLANRIVQMAEAEQRHEQDMREKALAADIGELRAGRMEARVGQVFGLLIGLGGLASATFIAISGSPIAGGAIGFMSLGSLVAVFIRGRQAEQAASEPAPEPKPQPHRKKRRDR